MRQITLTLSMAVLVAVSAGHSAADTAYVLRDLGRIDASPTRAVGVNSAGQIVGYAEQNGVGESVLWNPDGTTARIPGLPSDEATRASAINDAGLVVGRGGDVRNTGHAWAWSAETGTQAIGELPGYAYSAAYGVNAAGIAVGACYSGSYMVSYGAAFRWVQGQQPVALQPLPECAYALARGISDNNWIAGRSEQSGTDPWDIRWQACVWDPQGNAISVGSLGGDTSEAMAINNNGWVAGVSDYAGDPMSSGHAFLYRPGLGIVEIPGEVAYDVNDAGLVVGNARVAGAYQAFVWSLAAGMAYLPVPQSCQYSYAYSISEDGIIVGQAAYADGSHAVAWVPVPEPLSVISLLLGVAGTAGVARLRRTGC